MPGGRFIRGTPTVVKGIDIVFGTGKQRRRINPPSSSLPDLIIYVALTLLLLLVWNVFV